FSTRRTGEVQRAGPYAAFLGNSYNPIWTQFRGKATVKTTKTLAGQTWTDGEPYMGISPHDRFEIASGSDLPAGLTRDRLDKRQSLLAQFDNSRKKLDATDAGKSLDRYRGLALDLVTSKKVRAALNLDSESRRLRETYGMTLFGQSCLTARRLVEAGCRFV